MLHDFRVICEDTSTRYHKDVIDVCYTLEESLQCSLENYYLNTSIEQWINGDWKLVAINGEIVNPFQKGEK